MGFAETKPKGEDATATAPRSALWQLWSDYLAGLVAAALLLGIAVGIFFGEYCSALSLVGDAFVGLLRMTVLPFIVTSLITNLGRLPLRQTRQLAVVAITVMIVIWCLTFVVIFVLPSALPRSNAGSFFSTAMVDSATPVDVLSIFVPSNVFTALASNHVPAIIFFCICMGAALATVPNRGAFIGQLQVASTALLRVAGFIAKLAPIGVFAIAASTAGTISLDEAGRLQVYLIIYCIAAGLLGFVILPLLVTSLTPLKFGQVWRIVRDPMITAFATGKLIIVLPMLIENTEKLLDETRELVGEELSDEERQEIELLYTTAYAFPHAGKLLSMLFIPFVSWFFGDPMPAWEYPGFYLSRVASYFAGPLIAIPFLLDQMQLPRDMFQLFLLAGVVGERVGDAIGAMHLAVFVLVTLTIITGSLQSISKSALQLVGGLAIVMPIAVFLTSSLLDRSAKSITTKTDVLAQMQLIEQPVESIVILEGEPNPVPRKPEETVIERVRRRGILRIGFNEDKVPFAYFNFQRDLVGFDINLAHALARDLDVTLEFVRFDRSTLIDQVRADHFDFVMSGLVGTLERSQAIQHSRSYMDVTLGFVVPDYRVRDFESLDSIRKLKDLKIGFVDLSRGFVSRLRQELPDATLVEIRNNRDYFQDKALSLDALLISAESGSAFTLLYPKHEVAIPENLDVKLPLFYAVGGNDRESRNLLDHWVELRQKDGTFREYYEHWILGESRRERQPRWSIIRNVLGWVD